MRAVSSSARAGDLIVVHILTRDTQTSSSETLWGSRGTRATLPQAHQGLP